MHSRSHIRKLLMPTAFFWILGTVVGVQAHDYQHGDLHIDHPTSKATPPGAPNGVAYMAIHYSGEEPERLLSASTPHAKRVKLHQSVEQNGIVRMKHIPLPYTFEPGSALVLTPGSNHFMLMGLSGPLKADKRVPLTLTFEKAGAVDVELVVEELGAMSNKGAMGHHH